MENINSHTEAKERKGMNHIFEELARERTQFVSRHTASKNFAVCLVCLGIITPLSLANAGNPPANALISGKVVEDLTGNGITADDAPIAGRGIRLFRDNGDHVFDAASDTLVKSDISRRDGGYAFRNLAPGT